MVHHVAGLVNAFNPHIGHALQALVVLGQRVLALPPLIQAVAAGLDRQRGGRDVFVDFQYFIDPVQLGIGDLVGRVAHDLPFALCIGPGPVPGQPICFALVQAGVGFHESAGHTLRTVVGFEVHLASMQLFQLIHPFCIPTGRLGGLRERHAKAFEVDEATDAFGAHTGVQHRDVATHAVAHQVYGLTGRVVVEQKVEVGQVVRKPVVVDLARIRVAVTAPVRGDDVTVLGKGVDHKLVGSRNIHPAVHHHQRRPGWRGLTPDTYVVGQIADRDKLAVGDSFDLVHLSHHTETHHGRQSKQRQLFSAAR